MTDRIQVHHGDSREVLKGFADASVDSCVTDPPYALTSTTKRWANSERTDGTMPRVPVYARATAGFMGQKWDNGETAFDPAFWREVYRVLKPGAHVVAFSGTRTYHRMACAIEDAGFEVRDQIGWLFGSGFPKSHNAGDGWGTALKPAWEPILLGRKPLIGTVAANVQMHGTGAINVDGCRVGYENDSPDPATNPLFRKQNGYANVQYPDTRSVNFRVRDEIGERSAHDKGRWPANIVHDGSEEVLAAFPDTASGGAPTAGDRNGLTYGDFAQRSLTNHGANEGSAARFFYTAKADSDDRLGSKHPTVKPVDLMQWLVRLVTPKGGLVLDPFAGTGTTGEAAFREGMRAILIEREERFVADINRRIALMQSGPAERNRESIKAAGRTEDAGPLFKMQP